MDLAESRSLKRSWMFSSVKKSTPELERVPATATLSLDGSLFFPLIPRSWNRCSVSRSKNTLSTKDNRFSKTKNQLIEPAVSAGFACPVRSVSLHEAATSPDGASLLYLLFYFRRGNAPEYRYGVKIAALRANSYVYCFSCFEVHLFFKCAPNQ